MTIEQTLRMRIQELEDLLTEIKQESGPVKFVELQQQLKTITLELAELQKKDKEFNEFKCKLEKNQSQIKVNGQDAVDYYAQLLSQKNKEMEELRRNLSDNKNQSS